MALADRILTLKLVTDVGDISKGMKTATTGMEQVDKAGKKVESRFGRIGKSARGISSSIGNWGKAFAGAIIIEGISKVADLLGDAYKGFRSGEKAAARLRRTFKNLGLSGKQAEQVLARIGKTTKALGISDDEANDAFNTLIKTTKGDVPAAMRRLGIAYDLVASGNAPNLGAALKVIDGAIKGSSKVVTKFGLDATTGGGRIAELGRAIKGSAKDAAALDPLGTTLNALGEDLEGVIGGLATGDFGAVAEGLQGVSDDIASFISTVGPQVQTFLDSFTGGAFGEFVTAAQKFGDEVGPAFLSFFEGVGTSLSGFIEEAGPALASIFSDIADTIGPVITELAPKVEGLFSGLADAAGALITACANILDALKPVIDIIAPAVSGSIGFVLELLEGILHTIADLLRGDFSAAFTDMGAVVDTIAEGVGTAIGGILPALQDILGDITTAALDIGQAILDGIVNTITGLPDTLVGILRDAVNGLIDMLNGFTFTIPAIEFPIPSIRLFEGTIADTGPLGGGTFTIIGRTDLDPFNIPHLASGGIVTRPTVALLGEAGREAVVPLDRLGGGSINVNITMGVGDPVAVGREVDRVLRAYRKRAGLAYT